MNINFPNTGVMCFFCDFFWLTDLRNGDRSQRVQLMDGETRVDLEMREDGETNNSRNTEVQRGERENWSSVLCPCRRGTVEDSNGNIIPASPV